MTIFDARRGTRVRVKMSMPDPQLKRKLKKREETRVRILKKKNEGIYHFLVSSQL